MMKFLKIKCAKRHFETIFQIQSAKIFVRNQNLLKSRSLACVSKNVPFDSKQILKVKPNSISNFRKDLLLN